MAFKDIDDPIVKSRLGATLSAHARLWTIRLLAKRTLSDDQIAFARHIVETELFLPAAEAERERKDNASKIIEVRLLQHPEVRLSETERRDKIHACAEELLAPHHKSDDLRSSIDQVVKKHLLGMT